MQPGEVFIAGGTPFMEKTDLHPWINVIATVGPTGTFLVGVMNTQPQPITVRKGTNYGDITATCRWQGNNTSPLKVATISPSAQEKDQQEETPTKEQVGDLVARFKLDESPFLWDS